MAVRRGRPPKARQFQSLGMVKWREPLGSLAVSPPMTNLSPAACSRTARFAQPGVPGFHGSLSHLLSKPSSSATHAPSSNALGRRMAALRTSRARQCYAPSAAAPEKCAMARSVTFSMAIDSGIYESVQALVLGALGARDTHVIPLVAPVLVPALLQLTSPPVPRRLRPRSRHVLPLRLAQ